MSDYKKVVKALRDTDFGDTCVYCEHSDMCKTDDCIILQAAAAIEELQAQLPKRGEWINHKDEHQCSVCRETVVVDEIRWEQIGAYDYCPRCGANMEVQE